MKATEDNSELRIRVLADDHFREGVLTRYQIFIDKKLWLPVEVEESTADGHLERTVIFGTSERIWGSRSFLPIG